MKLSVSRNSVIIAFIVILVVLLFVLPATIPTSITVPGKVLPAQSWYLVRDTDGSLSAFSKDVKAGRTKTIQTFSAERGDMVTFRPNQSLTPGGSVQKGDTLGLVHSELLLERLEELRGKLGVLEATLAAQQAGEKAPIVEEARHRLELAREEAAVQQQIVNRQRALFEKNLLSKEEFELARGQYQVAKLEVLAAEAHLASVQMGEREQVIQVTQAQIRSVHNRIAVIERQLEQAVLRSPMAGSVIFSPGDETIMSVESSPRLAILSIALKNLESVSIGDSIVHGSADITGEIIRVGHQAFQMNGEQVVSAYATLDNSSKALPTGLIAPWKVMGTSVSPAGYIMEFFQKIFLQ